MIDLDYRMGRYFSFREMTTTNHRAFLEQNITEAWNYRASGVALARTVLDVARDHFGKPYHTNSGFRCDPLNKWIGGSPSSQHLRFQAHDGWIDDVPLVDLFEFYMKLNVGCIGQCILEGYADGKPSWVHVSIGVPFRKKEDCGQFKVSIDGGVTFHTLRPGERAQDYLK